MMQEAVEKLLESIAAGKLVAYCRLVETRGSTPQKPGAVMLIFEDGSQHGTLGGGCVEAEVKRRALSILATGVAEIASFQLDSDYGWDDGLICGGRMQILIDPLSPKHSISYFEKLGELILNGNALTEAIVFDSQQNDLPASACFLFDEQENMVAVRHFNLDSEKGPSQVHENLRDLLTRPRAYAEGGIAYLPNMQRCRLVIVGAGHIGKAVAELAADLDFDVWVVDDREEYVSQERFPRAQRRLGGKIDDILPQLEITSDTYCLIVTRGHNHDEQALYHLVQRDACYIGMIGSRRKIKMIYDDLLNEGIAAEALEKVYAPLGIHIGSQTVPEIAVSICAELISHRNREGVVPGRPKKIVVEDAK